MYIKSQEHLENFIKKVVSENVDFIDSGKILPINFIIEKVFSITANKKAPDDFSWALKSDPTIVEEENFFEWYRKKTCHDTLSIDPNFEHLFTGEFKQKIEELEKIPGVYLFTNKKDASLYIGMSMDLRERVLSSFKERFSKYNKPVYLYICRCNNASDASILELYFINLYKPSLNGSSKYNADVTLNIDPIPNFEHPVLCNTVSGK